MWFYIVGKRLVFFVLSTFLDNTTFSCSLGKDGSQTYCAEVPRAPVSLLQPFAYMRLHRNLTVIWHTISL